MSSPLSRLREAIAGERRHWHVVEVSPDDIAEVVDGLPSLRRKAYLAYLFLNLETCPACRLPKAQGLICPCGADE